MRWEEGKKETRGLGGKLGDSAIEAGIALIERIQSLCSLHDRPIRVCALTVRKFALARQGRRSRRSATAFMMDPQQHLQQRRGTQ